MDPLSVIASIAGVSTAGIALSRAIYDTIASMRNAPKEICDIAKGLYDLSFILRELRRVLKDGQDIYRRKLIKRVASAIKRVGRVQREIEDLLDITGIGGTLNWLFRKSKIQGLLYTIESYKTGINMILQTMMLAAQLKQLSKECGKGRNAIDSKNIEESWNDTVTTRHQAENVVQMSYHSLRELASEKPNPTSQSKSDEEENIDYHSENSRIQKYEGRDPQSLDSAAWLYDLVFSAVVEATAKPSKTEYEQDSASRSTSIQRHRDDREAVVAHDSSTQALVTRRESPIKQLRALEKHPPIASMVINELLSDWTTLTGGEITATDEINLKQKGPEIRPQSGSTSGKQVLKFEDAVGRKYLIRFALVQHWVGMERMINEIFEPDDTLRSRVRAGSYDVLDSAGNIMVRSAWKDTVKPGERYRMVMWPADYPPTPGRPGLSRERYPAAPQNPPTLGDPVDKSKVSYLVELFAGALQSKLEESLEPEHKGRNRRGSD
ncbi:hypothetical protein F5X98DRAFT_369074 [Xylaria grammica]|nr:hypothetical protein F5X98DRAFT_369074 [Xylaria grammica]